MKLAIIGTGKIVAEFLSFAADLDGIDVSAVFGRSPEKVAAIQASFDIATGYSDYAQCLADPKIDTVYIAVPNQLHFAFARQALLAGKHVICEKPFTTRLAHLDELRELAVQRGLMLVEAISNQYQPNYSALADHLPDVGAVKLIQTSYSQYSSRYDDFRRGVIQPAFDPAAGGGALMDLGVYNVHFVVGLLGAPLSARYLANIERGIDTSGVLVLDYGTCKAVCVAAKDSATPNRQLIQGDAGTVTMDAAPNDCGPWQLTRNDGDTLQVFRPRDSHRMIAEFMAFAQMFAALDVAERDRRLEHSRVVLQIVLDALAGVGIELG